MPGPGPRRGAARLLTALLGASGLVAAAGHDYPTAARVEFVQECMFQHGGEMAYLYKCSCQIDHIAAEIDYDDFVEASTYARNSTLGGDAGAMFRDPQRGKELTRLLRDVQARSARECGVAPPGR
jgi:hypothetical protein